MNDMTTATTAEPMGITLRRKLGQIVLVLQGGGALGAYQVGVYQALHEAGIEPDWVVGTSIGAINASLITGNPVERRMERLEEFWAGVEHSGWRDTLGTLPGIGGMMATWMTMASGINGFFTPNPLAFTGQHSPLGAEAAGYYRTAPLRETLCRLVDFDQVRDGGCRLTVGAANVRTSEMTYFDSRKMPLCVEHVMASGALPPAFPAVRVGSDLFWDGGILSNTPVEAIFDDYPRRSSLVFAVHLWNPQGPEPTSIWDVTNRQKDVQYSSRALSHILKQKQLHRMRHIIAELAKKLPDELRQDPEVMEYAGYGCMTQMHIVRLLAPRLDHEDHTKDIDFSRAGVRKRRQAGYEHTRGILGLEPWNTPVEKVEGVVLHET
ncbi:MAG TPA: patatin-like phospholipase family protein, partial [Acetobacteraceae bacterium]